MQAGGERSAGTERVCSCNTVLHAGLPSLLAYATTTRKHATRAAPPRSSQLLGHALQSFCILTPACCKNQVTLTSHSSSVMRWNLGGKVPSIASARWPSPCACIGQK